MLVFMFRNRAGIEYNPIVFDPCDYRPIGSSERSRKFIRPLRRRNGQGAGWQSLARKTAAAYCRTNVDYLTRTNSRLPTPGPIVDVR